MPVTGPEVTPMISPIVDAVHAPCVLMYCSRKACGRVTSDGQSRMNRIISVVARGKRVSSSSTIFSKSAIVITDNNVSEIIFGVKIIARMNFKQVVTRP
jgi:hypothetical protein